MSQQKALIRLAPGEVGFYDEITRIHLTMSRPQAYVYSHMNTVALIRAVRNRVIVLVAGTLAPTAKTVVSPEEQKNEIKEAATAYVDITQAEAVDEIVPVLEVEEAKKAKPKSTPKKKKQ